MKVFKCFIDGTKELLLLVRLLDKIDRAVAHRFYGNRDIAMPSQDNNRHIYPPNCHFLLDLNAIHFGHSHVK